ncbi:hypothetical protein CORC01_12414 [Colletotrichum orchidophilum]|uniref:Glycine zipper 2TM domain-containing protein n=1 Tax=Colletotrichum orchidophilum TaxID=1209926 RepID=A0A1G4AT02_9PEZI|nr:uncharacterized protein CORC01_12414 [Colletotrichum orchidophilum]OHE92299.1 hypothetical protein CORC01_12414 [Colletotrichum orchidophilum]
MSRYYEHEIREDRPRSPSHHRRDDPPPMVREYSPEYYSGGGAGPIQVVYPDRGPIPIANGPYVSGAIPVDAPSVHPYYGPESPLSPRDTNALQLSPHPHYRPRSLPPQAYAVGRPRSRSRPRSPIGKVRHAVDSTFTQSSSGIGVGLLGAVVGGLAAREVSDATVRSRNRKEIDNGTYRPRSPRETEKARVISTVVGALVGGLGANAIERRFEVARERDREQQLAWERKWGRERNLPHYDTGRDHDWDNGRGRLRNRRRDEWNDGYPDYGYEDRRGRLRSEERYSYRN